MNQMEVIADGRPWRDYLSGLILHGVKLGLDNIRHLLLQAGSPERGYPCVHVAGTNGKGSAAAFLDAMLRARGLRVGKFTSPHLLDITERFQINGDPIPETELRENIEYFQKIAGGMPQPPTFFELNTAVAFRWFGGRGVDVAVIEVGMGGRFDATNVITPAVCAITSIGLDHTQYLGGTLGEIAFEKAGILKPGVPCVAGPLAPEAAAVIAERAAAVGAPLLLPGVGYAFSAGGAPLAPLLDLECGGLRLSAAPVGLPGAHQAANAAVAAVAASLLPPPLGPVTETQARAGLAGVRWPCRMERVLDDPPVYVDVAHNPDGVRSLAAVLGRAVVVFAVSSDKDAAAMLEALAPVARRLILTVYGGGRCMPLTRLNEMAGSLPHGTAPDLAAAIRDGLAHADADTPLLVCGSVYAAGEARRILMERHGAAPPCF